MRKVLSLIIGFCFLVNNVSFALSPPMVSGDLGEHTIQNKDIAFIQSKLAYALGELDKLEKIAGETDAKKIKDIFEKHEYFKKNHSYKEGTVFNPAKITPYFNMLKSVGGNIFRIPMQVYRNGVRKDYQLLFSTIKGDAKCFPTYFLTDEDFDKLKNSVSAHNKLPYMKEDDAKFVDRVRTRYTEQNEEVIDKFIENIITGKAQGGGFTEIEGRRKELSWDTKFPAAQAPKIGTVPQGQGQSLFSDVKEPEEYLSKNCLYYFARSLRNFLSQIDEDFDLNSAISGKNLVFLKLPKGSDYPVIKENSENVHVFSHTSNNAVYLFLKEAEYNLLKKADSDGYFDEKEEETAKGEITPILENILKNLVHEIGVIYAAHWWLERNGEDKFVRINNDFDLTYEIYLTEPESRMEESTALKLRAYFSRGPVNLDELFWKDPMTGEFVLRDHAMEKTVLFETDPEKRRQVWDKKRFAMQIALAIYEENKDKFGSDMKKFAEFRQLFNEQPLKELKIDLNVMDMRFKMYLDAVIAYYLVNGETPSIDELNLTEIKDVDAIKTKYTRGDADKQTFSDLSYNSFSQKIDMVLRRKAVSIVRKVMEISVREPYSKVSMATLRDEVRYIGYSYYLRMIEEMYNRIQYQVNAIFTYFYGTEDFHIASFGFHGAVTRSLTEIHARETNPYWQAVEKDLAESMEADNTVVIERNDSAAPLCKSKLQYSSAKTGEIDEKFELENESGCDLLQYVFKTYERLNDLADGVISDEWFRRLPEPLQAWTHKKFEKILGGREINDETRELYKKTISLPLNQFIMDLIQKAREMKIFIEKDRFFASPRTMEISHVRRGLLQEDTGFHVGEYFLREFLNRKGVSEEAIVEDFLIFMLNEAMHVGNSIMKHGEIETLYDFNEKIEHINIPAVNETREKWVNYAGRPWEPMADADASAKRPGIFIGKDPKIIAGLERAKQFVSNDDERILLVRGAKGDGKSHFAKAVREMMGIKLGDYGETRYYRVPCAELSALDDNKYIRDRFFGKLSEDGQLSSSVLAQLLSDENKKSLLVFDHIEKANDYIFSVLNELLNDPGEISPENKNLKILILADEEATYAAAAKSNLHSLKTGLQNQTVRIPKLELCASGAGEKYRRDFMDLAEKFNSDYSKKKKIPLARIEKNLGDILIDWSKLEKSSATSVRGLEGIMERLTQTRKILLERIKKTGNIGRTDIFGKELELHSAFILDEDLRKSAKFENMFSPYVITIIDLLYSGIGVPVTDRIKYDIREAMKELHRKFQKPDKNPIIYPYIKELAPGGFYYGPRYEQPGMKKTEITNRSNDQNTALTKSVMAAMDELPKHYREKNGTNHEDVASAIHEVPYLEYRDVKSVMDYMEKFFAKYLFGGNNCNVKVEKVFDVSRKMKKKNKNANLMEKVFKNPPEDFDAAIFIDVVERGEKFKSTIETETSPTREISDAYNVPYLGAMPTAYHICAAFKKNSETNNLESIHVEVRSNETLDLEQEFDIPAKQLKSPELAAIYIRYAMEKNVTQNLLDLKEQKKLPNWIAEAIDGNIIDLSRFAEEKGALVFSENVTFKNGVGVLLSKLVKAGIEVAVIAREDGQIDAINALNRIELADTQGKIVVLGDPSEARDVMTNTGHFYYFCVREDAELDLGVPGDFSVNDITGMVKQIIEALGRASGIVKEAEIRLLHSAAEKFAHSV